jgi:hypothetical protein
LHSDDIGKRLSTNDNTSEFDIIGNLDAVIYIGEGYLACYPGIDERIIGMNNETGRGTSNV